jgi:hypothetical protein
VFEDPRAVTLDDLHLMKIAMSPLGSTFCFGAIRVGPRLSQALELLP